MTPRLTGTEFDRAAPFVKKRGKRGGEWLDSSIAMVRAVLVDGRKQAEVAREFKVSRQWVSARVKSFFSAFLVKNSYPPNWVYMEISAPAPVMEKLLDEIEKRRCVYLAKKGKAR